MFASRIAEAELKSAKCSRRKAATTNPPTLERHLGGGAVSLMHFLQRTIGNQATLRLLRRQQQDRVIEPAQCPPQPFNMRGRIPHKLLHRLRLSSGRPQPNVLRRQPANQPDEPLDVALARQDLLDRIAEDNRKLREQLDAAQVGIAERDVQVAPFFVQEDPEIQRTQRQIASGRAQVPARLAKLQQSLTLAAKLRSGNRTIWTNSARKSRSSNG